MTGSLEDTIATALGEMFVSHSSFESDDAEVRFLAAALRAAGVLHAEHKDCVAELATVREADAQNHAQLEQIYGRVHGLEELVGGLRAELATVRIEKEELAQQVNYHSGRAADARADLATARAAAKQLLDWFDDDCRFDHHGICQAHTFDEPCPIPTMRAWLASVSPPTSGERPTAHGDPGPPPYVGPREDQ